MIRLGKTSEPRSEGSNLFRLRSDFQIILADFSVDLSLAGQIVIGASEGRIGVAYIETDPVKVLFYGKLDKAFQFFESNTDTAQLFLTVRLHRKDTAYLLFSDRCEWAFADSEKNLLRLRVSLYDVLHAVQ